MSFLIIFSFMFGITTYNKIIEIDNIRYYLGDAYSSKSCLDNNIDLRIIVNCTYDLETIINESEINFYRVPISDLRIKKSTTYILENIDSIYADINKQIKFIKQYENESFSILFFCRNGTQRSATCLALFLLRTYNLDAIDIVKKNRKMALKPFLFKNCVNEYKKKYLLNIKC